MENNQEKRIPGVLTGEEIDIARRCMAFALENGADKIRVTLNKGVSDILAMLDGTLDKIAHSLDRSISFSLFVDGRFGAFGSNRIEEKELQDFIRNSIGTVRMLAPDPCRDLPDPARTAKNALTGRELDLYDPAYETLTAEDRLALAERSTVFARRAALEDGFTLLSEEGEYSDSICDSIVLDSNGLQARHTETYFGVYYSVTVADGAGNRYSSSWWDGSSRLSDVKVEECSPTAIRRAAAQIGPRPNAGGRLNLVVDSECASMVLGPVLSALDGYLIQQNNSFLRDKLGERVFPETLTVLDEPQVPGRAGSHLFDSEGVATRACPIIEKGVISQYFINTYMSRKLGMAPTAEDPARPRLVPVGGCVTREDVLRKMDRGILVTGFNGGNSNPATGDFSYGIDGFWFEDGVIRYPVREMVMTGNFIDLWNHLAVTGNDARPCMSRIVPTLAFTDVDFSS